MAAAPPPPEPPRKVRHDVAVWAGTAAFFGSLLAIGVFDVLNPDEWLQWFGAVLVSAITAGSVYSKERLDAAKREEEEARGQQRPSDVS